MELNIGIDSADRKKICTGLSRLLADSYTLYLKTQNFHWNVTGPMFNTLHTMFEEQYTELATAVDEAAERIRALGEYAPGSFAAFKELSSIEEREDVPSAEEMVKELVRGHETVVRTAREAFPDAETAGDESTCDFLIERTRVHEKTAWMLRSMVQS